MGSPIKRSSVKENTSPGQGNHCFLAEVSGRVAYSLRQSLFFAFAGMFLRWCRWICAADLHRTWSPIRIKAFAPLGVGPLPHLADQKIFGSMPCPSVFWTNLVVLGPTH